MSHRYFLEEALKEATRAKEDGQIPVGAVIVNEDGEIIARAHNEVNRQNDRTAHAEMLAIREAVSTHNGEQARSWTIYITLEPCPMCLGAIVMSNIGAVVWAAPDVHIDTHKLLDVIPYFRAQTLSVVKNPYPDLEKKCREIHNGYWISNGRPDIVEPIADCGNAAAENAERA
jgi:tRNA(adenine34) deaminase